MFWFKNEKPVETKEEDVIPEVKQPLKERIKLLYDNLRTIKLYDIKDAKLNFTTNRYVYGSGRFADLMVEFDSNLGKVIFYITNYSDKDVSLQCFDKNGLVFHISCIGSSTTVQPCFSRYNNLKASDVDLALYEVEHYIEEKHLDKVSLETYNAQQLNKLIEQSAERIEDK